jgi:hypothetical protein
MIINDQLVFVFAGLLSTPLSYAITNQTETETQTQTQTPDQGCAFHPDSPNCKPDQDGNCPTGFSHRTIPGTIY